MSLLTTFNVFCFIGTALTILRSSGTPICEPIKISLCQRHLPYNMTMFPNALEQLSQKHARQKIELFRAIVAINCSREAGFFLCSYHLPICAPAFKTRPIRPCRSVCEKVMADCMPTIRRYKAKWPEDVNCEDLPSYDSDVCVTRQSFVNSVGENGIISQVRELGRSNSFIHHITYVYYSAGSSTSSCKCTRPRLNFHFYQKTSYRFVLKVQLQSTEQSGGERILQGRVQRVLEKGLIDLKKGDTIRLHSNTTCDCPQVHQLNAEYLVAGHEDVRQKKLYLFPGSGVVETWERAWVPKFRKWERRLAAKLVGKKVNRKDRKRRRKVAFSLPDPSP